jgi:signal transduction histidine kinase
MILHKIQTNLMFQLLSCTITCKFNNCFLLILSNYPLKKSLLLSLLFIFFQQFLYAQKVLVINDKYHTYYLNDYVEITQNVPTLHSLTNIPADSLFKENTNSKMVHFGANWPKAWSKFSLSNHTTLQYYVLTIEQSRADTVCLFELMPDGSLVNLGLVSRATPFNKRQIVDRNYVYNLSITPGRVHNYYLYSTRKYANHGLIIGLEAQRLYAKQVGKSSLLYGLIIGILLFVAFVAICFYFFSKNNIPLYYGLYCFFATLVILADNGFINAYLQLDYHQDNFNLITIVLFYITVALHIKFTLVLLDMGNKFPKWFFWLGQASYFLFILCGVLVFCVTNHEALWWLCSCSYYVVFFVDLYILISIVYSLYIKQPSALFYFFAFGCNLIIISIIMLGNLNVLKNGDPNFDYLYLGPLFEIAILSLGLALYFSQKIKKEYEINQSLNRAQSQLLTLQENERSRIAQDLHDDVGNSLAAIKLGLASNSPEETDRKLQQVIKDLRNITHDLKPSNFQNLSLFDNVNKLFSELNQNSVIQFNAQRSGIEYKKNEIKELAIFRIIKELVNNSLKHSDAKGVHLQMHFTPDGLLLSYEDDGTPYLLKKSDQGIGFNNIQNRVMFLDGGFSQVSNVKGNLLQFQFPLY